MKDSFTKKVKDEITYIKNPNFLQKKFLTNGLINNPKVSYHLEYNFTNVKSANMVMMELAKIGIIGKLSINKKEHYIVYIVDKNTILEWLKKMKLFGCYKEYKQIVDYKSKISNTVRQVNFETANIKRMADANYMQLTDINEVLKIKKISELDADLQLAIKLRKKYNNLSLTELARKTENMSKNSLNHKFIKLRKILKKEKNNNIK